MQDIQKISLVDPFADSAFEERLRSYFQHAADIPPGAEFIEGLVDSGTEFLEGLVDSYHRYMVQRLKRLIEEVSLSCFNFDQEPLEIGQKDPLFGTAVAQRLYHFYNELLRHDAFFNCNCEELDQFFELEMLGLLDAAVVRAFRRHYTHLARRVIAKCSVDGAWTVQERDHHRFRAAALELRRIAEGVFDDNGEPRQLAGSPGQGKSNLSENLLDGLIPVG